MLQQSSPVRVRCFEMSKPSYSMFPFFRVCEEESALATRASAGSLRWTQRCAIKSCITGCRDDRGVRGCLSHHHTCCSVAPLWLSLLFCFILSHLLCRSLSCLVVFSPVLSLNQSCCFSPPKNTFFFTFFSSIVLHQAPLLLILVVFGRGSCKHSCLWLHICIQHHRLRLMAWLSPLQPKWMTALLPLMLTLSLLLTQALASFTGWNAPTQCSLASWRVLKKIQMLRLFLVREIMAPVGMLCALTVFLITLVMIILPVSLPLLALIGKIMQWMKAGLCVSKEMCFGFIY